jgi:hypothetical protein
MKVLVLTYGFEKWALNRIQGNQSYFEDTMATQIGAWRSAVVKALRYLSDGPGIDSWWCHWIFL